MLHMKQTNIVVIDDLDGTVLTDQPDATRRFSIDGQQYEIDLSDANAEKLREAVADFTKVARPIAGRGRPTATKTPAKRGRPRK